MNTIAQAVKNMSFREKNGGWEGRISYRGQQRSFYGKSKAECRRKAVEFQKEVEKGTFNPNKVTLNAYMENWLTMYKMNSVEPSSFARLYSVYIHQIKDGIGKKKLAEIKVQDIQKLINEHTKGSNGKKALAESGIKKIIHLLSPCFARAVREGIIGKNPCEDVEMPKRSNIVTETKEQIALSDEEIALLCKAALVMTQKGILKYRDGGVLVFMLLTGLRVGEMLALCWNDINDDYIHVHRTVQRSSSEEEKFRIKEGTKTSKERMLRLNEDIKTTIRLLREYDTAHGIESEFVACNTVGKIHEPRNIARSLEKVENRAGLMCHITPHTLRHTFGSKLLRDGVNVEVVSKLMGHANIMVTYNKYTHVIKEQEAKGMTMVSVVNGKLDDLKND